MKTIYKIEGNHLALASNTDRGKYTIQVEEQKVSKKGSAIFTTTKWIANIFVAKGGPSQKVKVIESYSSEEDLITKIKEYFKLDVPKN